jgi:hypothetical protein
MKADEFMDSQPGRALISTEGKKNGQEAIPVPKLLCLAKDCVEMVQAYLPLCKLCYLQSMAGKIATLALRDGLGNAVFNTTTKRLDFPAGVPQSGFPKKGLKKGRKVLMAGPMCVEPASEVADSLSNDVRNILTNQNLGGVVSSVLDEVSDPDIGMVLGHPDGVNGLSILGDPAKDATLTIASSEVASAALTGFRSSMKCLISRERALCCHFVC